MEREERFDSFYRSNRADLLHQCFALTGDLPAAQSAVRDAFVAAWHHWRKADAHGLAEEWVRPRAWALAHRRHTARIWHRTKDIDEQQLATLDALARVPYLQRRLLLLAELAAVPLPQAAREVGLTQEAAERGLQAGTSLFALQRDVAPSAVPALLAELAGPTAALRLPRASAVRRAGRRRRRWHTVLAALTAVAIALVSGAIAYEPAPAPAPATAPLPVMPSAPPPSLPSPRPHRAASPRLLDADQVTRLGRGYQDWQVVPYTGDDLDGTCRASTFADPQRRSAQVRAFQATGDPARGAVQRVEVATTPEDALQAFGTTLGWYAGCEMGRLQLTAGYRVDGVGDEAAALRFRLWREPATTYWVTVARVGVVTTSTVSWTVAGRPPPSGEVAQSLADSVAMVCPASGPSAGVESCAMHPALAVAPPATSAAERGLLTAVDLPPVGDVRQPWVGTTPRPPRNNPAATTCDQADFGKAGAVRARTRTFLVPEADLPTRFGLSETYGLFGSVDQARAFMATMQRRVDRCESRHLATTVHPGPRLGKRIGTWRLDTAVTARRTVAFRLGFVRAGAAVAEVTFSPAGGDDISSARFRGLVVRAGQRLRELGPGGTRVGP